MRKVQVRSITPREQFAYYGRGTQPTAEPMRATITKTEPGIFLLQWHDGEQERACEFTARDTMWVDYDLLGVPHTRRCTRHGYKIQRPGGEFSCDTCYAEYGKRYRRRRAIAKAEGRAPETVKERHARERREAIDAKLDRLMASMAGAA